MRSNIQLQKRSQSDNSNQLRGEGEFSEMK